MQLFRVQKPFIFTIFGASGDLAKIKLFPALYKLMEQKRFPKNFYIVGFARSEKTHEEFQKEFEQSIKQSIGNKQLDNKILEELTKHVYYYVGKYDKLESFKKYAKFLDKLTRNKKVTHAAYFSVPPQVFGPIITNLAKSRKSKKADIRLIIEKPFGENSHSAEKLYHHISQYFDEEQIYLLDHYLGKAAVQSILHLRHANRILNLLLKGAHIANIQITAFEDTGISSRVGYFDEVGIIKDMVQSHLLQILALITMSIPITESAVSLHREKSNILSAIKLPRSKDSIALGQYAGYKKEGGVPKNSKTETFVALKLLIDRESWYKVPIYIRTGKKLDEKHTYIAIEFKKFDFQSKTEKPNILLIELHPDEIVSITLLNKNYFGATNYQAITTSRSLACTGDDCLPEHGLLLMEVLRGRKINFLSFSEILSSWKVADAIRNYIKRKNVKVETYKDNSPGPVSQDKIPGNDGFEWYHLHE